MTKGRNSLVTWPKYLEKLINNASYEVFNLAATEKTVMDKSGASRYQPYSATEEYEEFKKSDANIVFIALGINDADASIWDEAQFKKEYF